MAERGMPQPGEIYRHFKDKLYQVITIASDSETGVPMVVYQALYGDFKSYVRPLDMFLSEVDKEKYPEVLQRYRFELYQGLPRIVPRNMGEYPVHNTQAPNNSLNVHERLEEPNMTKDKPQEPSVGDVNAILMEFLDADSYSKKLNIISGNMKHLNDRLINDMAVSLDCAVEEGPLERRIQELVFCLKAMSRFEDKRFR